MSGKVYLVMYIPRVRERSEIQAALTRYQERYGCQPVRAAISERCSFTEHLALLDGMTVERQRCILSSDLYLEIPGGELCSE